MYIRLTRLHPKLAEAKVGDICQVSRQLGTRLIELGAAKAATMEDTIGKRVVPEAVPPAPIPIVLPVMPSETQEVKHEFSIKEDDDIPVAQTRYGRRTSEPKKRTSNKRASRRGRGDE